VGPLATICVLLAALAAPPAFAETDPATGMEFVQVKGGCFLMGDTLGEGDRDERPVHEVCVSDFRIGRYKVTQEQWEKVMGSNPSRFRKGGEYPVENVSWDDARRFIRRLNEKTGRDYRFPTEAEWEYAARSGGKDEKYAGARSDKELGDYAWYFVNSRNTTHPVGKKLPNGLGLYDMTGIVWEWCGDWYGERYYSSSPRKDPAGPAHGWYRVLRGGSWDTDARNSRTASRYWGVPEVGNGKRGFRLLRPVGLSVGKGTGSR
jgi:sulfatase modifying factor 1